MSGRGVLRIIEGGAHGFWCPGCEEMHVVDSGWTFDGNYEVPTFSPSILVTWRTPKGFTRHNPAPLGWHGEYTQHRCHSFVRGGHIEFLSDCSHALAGRTVKLEIPPI